MYFVVTLNSLIYYECLLVRQAYTKAFWLLFNNMFVQSCETDLKISTFVELRKCYETNYYCIAIHVRRLLKLHVYLSANNVDSDDRLAL